MNDRHGLILLYHRVIDLPLDPQLLAVTPERFANHLEVLRRRCRPMPLRDVVDGAAQDSLPPRSVAITFDDGYADNLDHVLPSLSRFKTPVTVFVAGGPAAEQREFWWDELERICFLDDRPEPLTGFAVGARFVQRANSVCASASATATAAPTGWNVTMTGRDGPREARYRTLYDRLRPLPPHERNSFLNDLNPPGAAPTAARATHRRLSAGELGTLAKSELVEIGAHTAGHPMLSALTPNEQRREIERNKRHLERLTDKPVLAFSYPYGTPSDYTEGTVGIVREVGFNLACANHPGLVSRSTDRFQLARMLVRDWDGKTFSDQLDQWWSNEA